MRLRAGEGPPGIRWLLANARRPELRAGVAYLLSSLAFQGARFTATLFAAALLGPAEFGQWALIVAVLAYTPYATIGIVNAMNRDVPIFLGGRRGEEAFTSERAALGASIVSATVLVAGITAAGVVLQMSMTFAIAFGLAAGFQQLAFCYQATLRARIRFSAAALAQFAMAGLFVVLAIPGLLMAGLSGLVAALAAAYALATALSATMLRSDLRPSLPVNILRSQVRTGLPIAIGGLAFAALTSQDRWVVAITGTATDLGQYGFASTMASGLVLLLLIVAQQMYPRMGYAFGHDGRDAASDLARRQSTIAAGIVAVAAVGLVLGTVVLVAVALPDYSPSVEPLVVLAMSVCVLGVASGATNLLLVVNRAWRLVAIYAAGTVAAFSTGYALAMADAGIVAPAVGTLVGGVVVATSAAIAVRA